jgi:hypothetical protein
VSEKTEGKGRPTPKRSDAQKRRGGPVAPPPTSRREAAKQLRAKQADQRQQVRKANLTGDDKLLLARDRGPVRRTVRDIIDSRRSLGWLLLPTALVVVLAGLTGDIQLQAITFGIWVATLVGVVMDMVLAGVMIRKTLRARFPDERKLRGHIGYGLLRTTVIRRFRMPRPQVKRGQAF